MSEFDVKTSDLLTNGITGYPSLHDDAKQVLLWLCGYCKDKGWPRPLVTCFGRTRDDQERIYLPETLVKVLETVKNGGAIATAKTIARNKYSLHCVESLTRKCRAFDIRTQEHSGDKIIQVFSGEQLTEIVDEARIRFGIPNLEAISKLHGTGPHLHLGIRNPLGRPADWL